jgi:hypothetical protein
MGNIAAMSNKNTWAVVHVQAHTKLRREVSMKQVTLIVFIVGVACTTSCREPNEMNHERQNADVLFRETRVGERRDVVEKRLGLPVAEVGDRSFYLPPPVIDPNDSPMAPGSIEIVYSKDGYVTRKEFYGTQPNRQSGKNSQSDGSVHKDQGSNPQAKQPIQRKDEP